MLLSTARIQKSVKKLKRLLWCVIFRWNTIKLRIVFRLPDFVKNKIKSSHPSIDKSLKFYKLATSCFSAEVLPQKEISLIFKPMSRPPAFLEGQFVAAELLPGRGGRHQSPWNSRLGSRSLGDIWSANRVHKSFDNWSICASAVENGLESQR